MSSEEVIKLRIPGTPITAEALKPSDAGGAGYVPDLKVKSRRRFRIDQQRGSGAESEIVEVKPDEVVEIEFDDGTRIWMSADRLTKEVLGKIVRRDADGVIDVPPALPSETASRGFVGKLVIKTLTFFGFAPSEKIARKIAKRWEKRTLKLAEEDRSELYRSALLPKVDELQLEDVETEAIPTDKAHLLLLHGTFSSTGGSFANFWTTEGRELRKQLHGLYDERVLTFEHRTLTRSPIHNTLRLASRLPAGAKLHIVSHSRGGLVGELLSRASVDGEGAPFTREELDLWAGLDPEGERGDLAALNRLLAEKRFEVEKFVRVACPSRGTSLASGRLDIYLSVIFNLLGRIPFFKLPGINVAFSILEELIMAIAKERADPDVLPGLEAMVPDSPLIKLINQPNATIKGALRVIAGDIEGENLGSAIAALLTDPLYQRNHDLVVDTEAMFGGVVRTDKAAYSFHQGADVSHFNYFENERSARHMVQALQQETGVPDAFEEYETEPSDETLIVATRSAEPRPTVFLIPGFMGSHLTAGNKRVWVDLGNLALGGIERLAIKASGVGAEALVHRYYGELWEFLATNYDVVPFAYDWRKSVADAAEELAEQIGLRVDQAEKDNQPISIIAHSMGGLVARLMIKRRPDLWRRMSRQGKISRLIMLGTPNQGSHSVPFMLTGRDSLIKKLALLDFKNSKRELLDVVSDYPGVLELLPGHGPFDFFSKGAWEQLLDVDGKKTADWKVPFQNDLDRARKIKDELSEAPGDPERMCYVAGWAGTTPSGLRIDKDSDGDKCLVFEATRQGDGRVPWATGALAGVKTWYMSVPHGDLARDPDGFPGIRELLEEGKTALLSESPPETRDGAVEGVDFPEERSPLFPNSDDLLASALGGRREDRRDKVANKIQVDIVHGNLAFASHPVMVGHYRDDSIVSAEASLDNALDGQLTRRHRLRRYPGPLNSAVVVLNERAKPQGAIVIGLGQVGELSPGGLMQSVSGAVREYALAFAERHRKDGKPDATPRFARLSTLLIGTGAGGVEINDSVSAILRGVANANDALRTVGGAHAVTIDRVEFVELYEDSAIRAAHDLRKLRDDPELRDRIISVDSFRIKSLRGGRTRASFNEGEGWWQRLQIIQDDKRNRLEFKLLTNRARAEMHIQATQRRLVDRFIDKVMTSAYDDPEIGATLFEMLVPYELKQYAPEQRNLVLVLNPDAARYPWELMRTRAHGRDDQVDVSKRPTAVDIGMVRQLQQTEFRQDVVYANSPFALVIGDPETRLAELKGAQREAKAVVSLLKERRYEPIGLIADEARPDTIMQALHQRDYRILHLAGHGVYDERREGEPKSSWFRDVDDRIVAGMVIGDDLLLTPAEVRQMRTVPEVVFINCCHLGRIDGDHEPIPINPPRLAANLATAFIRMGVRAVVAAGWAVDDQLATVFAEAFYRSLLDGDMFGDAVQHARRAAFDANPRSNTWGAYQCYGDPAFTLKMREASSETLSEVRHFASPSELIVELNNRTSDAQTAKGRQLERIRREILSHEKELPETWKKDARLHIAFGDAFGQIGDFERAIEHYESSIKSEKAIVPLWVLEQLSNFQARIAPSLPTSEDDKADRLFEDAAARINYLIALSGSTSERHSLLGSIAKRRIMRFSKTDTERKKALGEMARHYKKAYEVGEEDGDMPKNPYPLVNEITAEVLLRLIDGGKGKVPEAITIGLSTARTDAARRDRIAPNYWDAGVQPDCLLLEKMADGKITPKEEGEIIEATLAARRRDGSPRELRSVREQMDFFCKVIDEEAKDTKRRDLAQAIGRIRSSLDV